MNDDRGILTEHMTPEMLRRSVARYIGEYEKLGLLEPKFSDVPTSVAYDPRSRRMAANLTIRQTS